MARPIYPRLSCKLDTRIKICDNDIKKIFKLDTKGIKISSIAKKFNVTYQTIKCILDPDFYEEQKKRISEIQKKRYKEDPNYKKYILENIKRTVKIRDAKNPKMKKFKSDYHRYYASKHQDTINKHARERRAIQKLEDPVAVSKKYHDRYERNKKTKR